MKNIEKYLKNKLPENQMNQLTKTLLKEAFETERKERLSNILEKKYKIRPPQKKRSSQIWLYSIVTIAASILLFFFASQIFVASTASNYPELVAAHLTEPFAYKSTRKGVAVEENRANAIEAYQIKDYGLAIKNYQSILDAGKGDIVDHFYLGLSYLYNNQSKQAIEAFSKAQSMNLSNTFQDKEDIKWFLSLAYLKDGQIDAAKKELKYIVDQQLFRFEYAEKLLQPLK